MGWMTMEPTAPLVLLEPGAVKVARRVLRGPRHSIVPGLPDHRFDAQPAAR